MANVRFIQTTKEKWLKRDTYDPAALYFCIDTGEIFKGNILFTEGVKIVPTRDDLPSFACAADGVVYFIAETKSGFMISPDRTEWLQTIYAPITNAYVIPEEEMYTTVTTVGAVRDIEKKIYDHIDSIKINGVDGLVPIDGTIDIANIEGGGKSIGVAIAPVEGNILTSVEGGLFVPAAAVKLADTTHGLVMVDGALSLNLVTQDSDGAMSKEDKVFLDELRDADIANTYATKDEVAAVRDSVASIEELYSWSEM